MTAYTKAVAQLLTLGSCKNHKDWPNYPAQLGLTSVDVPELIRMATDPQFNEVDSSDLEVWASIHAMRALGQLQAVEAIAPLTELLSDDGDWVREELPQLFAMFGAPAIEPLVTVLKDDQQDEWTRVCAIDSLGTIGLEHPAECRDPVVNILVEHLRDYPQNGAIINSSLVFNLTDLKATEVASLIEEVFSNVELDEFLTGSWPMVQVQLGLKQESDFSAKELQPKFPPALQPMQEILDLLNFQPRRKPQGFGNSLPSAAARNPKKNKKKNQKKKK